MTKMMKGAVAILAAVVLLVGGGGTLALWNIEASIWGQDAVLTSGSMKLTAAPGTWTDQDGNLITDISSYPVSPGETLTYTQDLDATLVGQQLDAKLSVTDSSYYIFNDSAVHVQAATLSNDVKTVNFLDGSWPDTFLLSGTQQGVTHHISGRLVLKIDESITQNTVALNLGQIEFQLSQYSA